MDSSSPLLKVRPATLADAYEIAKIHVQSWQEAYRQILPAEYLASLSIEKRAAIWHESLERDHPEVWVAEFESTIVGWVALGECRDEVSPIDAGEVWAIYVSPSHWSRGVGRELWLTSRRRFTGRDHKVVTLWVLNQNVRAIRFYAAAGFWPNLSTTRQRILAGQTVTEVRYELTL
jgi:ribosomal protein S18 acetylase RimI-like enzyme